MKYIALPMFMSEAFFRKSSGYGVVGTTDDYVERPAMEVEGNTPEAAAEQVWRTYQNIDENHMTPDGGRSMMVGDLVLLRNRDTRELAAYRAAMMGFERVNFAREGDD